MELLHPRCAGLDVHKDTVVACVRRVSPPTHQEVRHFATTTTGLLALADWPAPHGCTHVTGRHLLEDGFALVLATSPQCAGSED
jgi:hypothetical protein